MQGLERRGVIGNEGRHRVEIWEILRNLAASQTLRDAVTLAKTFCIKVDTAW